MSEHAIKHLGDMVKQILDVLKSFMHQIMEALNILKRLPEMITQLRNDLNQGFSNVIQSQGEMEIYVRMAQMRSKRALLKMENEAISDFENDLKEDLAEIDKRYSKINDELDEECKKRIREIDQHLLEIPDKFPQDLYMTFQKEIIPLCKDLVEDSRISYTERVNALKLATEKADSVINNFLKVRNDFFEQVKGFEVPEEIKEVNTYHVPVWLVETESGKKKKKIVKRNAVLPGKFNHTEGNNIKNIPAIETKAGFKNLQFIEESGDIQKRMINKFKWTNNEAYQAKLLEEFSAYFNSIHKGKHKLLKNAILRSMKKYKLHTISQTL